MPVTSSTKNEGLQLIVREASAADNSQICAQMRRTAMPGRISLVISHDPSFFESMEVEGYGLRVIVGERDGQVVGVGLMAKRQMYVNGLPTEIGHVSTLRIDPSIRNTTALARGFRLFKQWHEEDSGPPFYLCTILQENALARRILTSGRAGLPASRDVGTLYTAAIPLIKRPPSRSPAGLSVVRGNAVKSEAIIKFLNRVGQDRQFFPVYTVEDLLRKDGVLRGLRQDDFHVAVIGDRIVGVTACWNQLPFRRIVVNGYSGGMRWLKPAMSPLTRLLKLAPLPNPGDAIQSTIAACIAIEGNEPKIFKALLTAILHAEYNTGKTFLMVGLMEADPLLSVARHYTHLPTRSCIQALGWDGLGKLADLDGRPPYMELGSL